MMTKFRLAGTVAAIALIAAVATTAVVAQQARSGENGAPPTGPAAGTGSGSAGAADPRASGRRYDFDDSVANDDLTAFLDLADDETPRGSGSFDDREMTGQGDWQGRRGWRDGEGNDRRGALGYSGAPAGMMMRRGGFGLCGPRGERIADMMLMRLERVTRPTDAQRAGFDKLKEAAAKAGEVARAGCPAEPSFTPTGRLANAEKRLEAMLQAIRTVRPAFEEFFASLNDEQKARLYAATSHRPGFWMRGGRGPRDGWYGPRGGGPERFGEEGRRRDGSGWPGPWRGRS